MSGKMIDSIDKSENVEETIKDIFKIATTEDAGVFSTNQTARSLARLLFNNISGIRVASKAGSEKKVYDDIVKVALSVLSL